MAAEAFIRYLSGSSPDARPSSDPDDRSKGWRLNVNNLRLSMVAHVRAAHRRANVTLARAAGIDHFMLEVPRRRRGKIAPSGACGRNLWTVRHWDEWLEIHDRENEGRLQSSSFDGLGFGYGDCTYLVPVPVIYLEAARAYGEKMRRRWLTPRASRRAV